MSLISCQPFSDLSVDVAGLEQGRVCLDQPSLNGPVALQSLSFLLCEWHAVLVPLYLSHWFSKYQKMRGLLFDWVLEGVLGRLADGELRVSRRNA